MTSTDRSVARVLFLTAIAVALAGMAVICGWYLELPALVQLRPSMAPMQFNAALAFVLAGAAQATCIRGWTKTAATLAFASGVLGFLTLVEYVTGLSLGIDEFFVTPFTSVIASYPGRMAPNTAASFILISIATIVSARGTRLSAVPPLMAMMVFSIASVSIIGYVLHISSAYRWGAAIPMALHTAVCFAMLSLVVVGQSWQQSRLRWPEWAPIAGALSALSVALLIWRSLVVNEHDQLVNTAAARAAGQCQLVQHNLRELVESLERMAAREARHFNGKSTADWTADAALYRDNFVTIASLGLYDDQGTLVDISPQGAPPVDVRASMSSLKQQRAHIQNGPPVNLNEVNTFHVVLPLDRDGRRIGYLTASCNLRVLMHASGLTREGGQVRVFDETLGDAPSASSRGQAIHEGAIELCNARWIFSASMPATPVVMSIPITLVLVFGVVNAALLAAAMHLLALNRNQASELRNVNERLQLAIRGGNIGTWEWDLGTNAAKTSPELNAQLGLPIHAISSYEEWQSRLHPHDRDQAESAIRDCLVGSAGGFESIYRLRHADGSYRQILSRGLVYRDKAGRPQRMAGTHVDITQQRALEQLFHAVFNETIQFIGILSPAGVVIDANHTALRLVGADRSDVIGKAFWDTPWWSHSKELRDQVRAAISRAALGSIERFAVTHLAADGSEIEVDFSLKPVRDSAGDVVYIIPEGRDITWLDQRLRTRYAAEAVSQHS